MIPSENLNWKREARLAARERRLGHDLAQGQLIIDRLLQELPPEPGEVVGGVWPLPGEIDLRPLLEILHRQGHRIALPFTTPRGQPLSFREWTPASVLLPGRFGTMHTAGAELDPDYVLVPLLAFDRAGHRLGYGAGHYDRTLARLPAAFAVGYGFADQEVPLMRAEPTDHPLDAIVTEREVIKPERAR